MNEELLKKFCEDCINFCNSHNLGIYMILSHNEGMVHVNQFPQWSVLQHTNNDETVQLVHVENESPKSWFKRVEDTLHFLDNISTDCKETAELTFNLKDALETALNEVFDLEETGSSATVH